MNKIINIDKHEKTVEVEAGITIKDLLNELIKHDLTLINIGSLTSQQLGGFTQIGVHGTGLNIGPADSQVKELTFIDSNNNEITLKSDDEDFNYINCSMGMFGILTKLKISCIDVHTLNEKTIIVDYKLIFDNKKDHFINLQENKHIKYLYMPYTGKVIVIKCNKTEDEISEEDYTQERKCNDILSKPLDIDHVTKINNEEILLFSNKKSRINRNDKILTFNCGPKQLVCEIAIPIGTDIDTYNRNDIKLMDELLIIINEKKIPAHGPIEQRWSLGSPSVLSPVYSETNTFFSWIGIILYLTDNDEQNDEIKKCFKSYTVTLNLIFLDISRNKCY